MTSGRSYGKVVAITFWNSSRETLLNWFVKSKKMAAQVGNFPDCCGLLMYFSMASCIALTMKSDPTGTPTA